MRGSDGVGRRGRHIRRRKKRIIEKQSRKRNRTRRWKWRLLYSQAFSGGERTSAMIISPCSLVKLCTIPNV